MNINDCATFPCHSGACVDGIADYTCNCLYGYTGRLCETNIDDCINSQCKNGATCQDGVGDYTCQCVPGYKGDMCQINIDDCAPRPCMNGGKCTDLVADYNCSCRQAVWRVIYDNFLICLCCCFDVVLVLLVKTVRRILMNVTVCRARWVRHVLMR